MAHGHRWLIGVGVVIVLAAALALIATGGGASLAVGDSIYVDADADPGGLGTSWTDAYTDLQEALGTVVAPAQIWVAAGIYKPTVEHGGSGDRYRSFQMVNGVAIYGGFDPSVGATEWEHRDWVANPTILSGDIGIEGDPADNSYHVFYHPDGTNLDSSAILDGFTITGGNADGPDPHIRGAGMYNYDSSPTLTNCTFEGNSSWSGGGIYNTLSSPTLTGCTFTGNSAYVGGGMENYDNSSPTLTNCTFSSNSATSAGGGIYNGWYSSPTLTDCTFTYNSTAGLGGGMHNETSSPTLANCTFSENSAAGLGGGIYNTVSSPTLTNCTFTSNSADVGGGMKNYNNSSPTLTNCTFSLNSASDGGGMHNEYFSSPTVTNCILFGINQQIVNSGADSTPLIAYSDIQDGCEFDPFNICGDGNIDHDPLFLDAASGDLRLQLTSPAIDAGNSDAVPAGITTDLGGHPRFSDVLSVPDSGNGVEPIVDMGAYETPPEVIFVDQDATGASNGQSWQDALTDFGDALAWAMESIEIWVAAGTYKPTDGTDRTISFQMMNGVAIYGGFAGTETERDQRDWASNETILSGDIGIEGDPADNSYHIFYHPSGTDLDGTAILDGFTITGGNANGDDTLSSMGGGMLNWVSSPAVSNCRFEGNSARATGGGMANESSSSPTLSNCTFYDNSAPSGGGMENWYYSSPVLINVTFSGNSAGSGGAVRNRSYSSPMLTNCTFEGNSAGTGGGMYNYQDSSPTLTGCAFLGNSANWGGGMANSDRSAPVLTDCIFSGNWADYSGGGMANESYSSPTLTNVTFTGNSAADYGGGMVNWVSWPSVLTNCTFNGNSAGTGGAIYNYDSSPVLTNCVLWGDTPEEMYDLGSSAPNVTFNDVQGGYPGPGNINEDPLFLDPDSGDLHLGPGSPCIDAGTNDQSLPAFDFEGDPRVMDGDSDGEPVVDMGVDEALWLPVYLPLVLRGY